VSKPKRDVQWVRGANGGLICKLSTSSSSRVYVQPYLCIDMAHKLWHSYTNLSSAQFLRTVAHQMKSFPFLCSPWKVLIFLKNCFFVGLLIINTNPWVTSDTGSTAWPLSPLPLPPSNYLPSFPYGMNEVWPARESWGSLAGIEPCTMNEDS